LIDVRQRASSSVSGASNPFINESLGHQGITFARRVCIWP
jgi:hypothetical protein